MEKIKISAVAYTNTKPFIYGLEHSDFINKVELSLDVPSVCAAKLIDGRVDIGLIPVAAFPHVPNANIVADYCIGSVGAVNSVFIFSQVPIKQIKSLRLDQQSRTSNNLAKVLLKFYWKQDVKFITDIDAESDAIVLIGDRTFGRREEYTYAYDMGEEWMNFTGLPFVYAAWIANRTVSESFIAEFNTALKYGLDQRKELLKVLPFNPKFDFEDYLMNKLNFDFTEKKREAMQLFLSFIDQLKHSVYR